LTAINFFSPYISGAQRLPNGNTLICEGCFGRPIDALRGEEFLYSAPFGTARQGSKAPVAVDFDQRRGEPGREATAESAL
jgi:hypothetical protein